jgi:hypothetical protein
MDEFTLVLEFECTPPIDDDTFDDVAVLVLAVPGTALSAEGVPGGGVDEPLEFERIRVTTTEDHPDMTTAVVETIRTFQERLDCVTPAGSSIDLVLVEGRSYEESERWRAQLGGAASGWTG